MALMEESFSKTFGKTKSHVTKLFEIKETAPASSPSAGGAASGGAVVPSSSSSLQLLRGIHITELFGTTINPDPRHAMDRLVEDGMEDRRRRQQQQQEQLHQRNLTPLGDIVPRKTEFVVDRDVIVRDHLTKPSLERLLVECQDLEDVTSLEIRVATSDSTVGAFGEFLPNLTRLKLNDSSLGCMRELGTKFDNLKVLWMCRCGLEDLDGISAMNNLVELYLSFNSVADLSPCGMLDSLEVLDLEGNALDDITQVDFLALCSSLTHLTLEGNPLCLAPTSDADGVDYDYRRRVADAIPHLKFLDEVFLAAELKEVTEPPKSTKRVEKDFTPLDSAKSDFSEDWALIDSFLGGVGGGDGGFCGSEATVEAATEKAKTASEDFVQSSFYSSSPRLEDARKLESRGGRIQEAVSGSVGGVSPRGPLTVRDIFSDPNELYRSTRRNSTETPSPFSASSSAAAATRLTSPTAAPPPFRVRTALIKSRPTTPGSAVARPSTSATRRPSTRAGAASAATMSSSTLRPATASMSEASASSGDPAESAEDEFGDPTYSELTFGGVVCGSIFRSLKSRGKKTPLPNFIDLKPKSATPPGRGNSQGGVGSGRRRGEAFVEMEDDMTSEPLRAIEEGKKSENDDDDFVIHVVESAQLETAESASGMTPSSTAPSSSPAEKLSTRPKSRMLLKSPTKEREPGPASVSPPSRSGVVSTLRTLTPPMSPKMPSTPPLRHVTPTPPFRVLPTSTPIPSPPPTKATGVSARRTKLRAATSGDGFDVLPRMNLKKSF